MQISRRDALLGATAAVAVAGLPTAVQAEDAELIALGRRWIDTYAAWLQCHDDDENTILLKRANAIEDRMVEMPVHSPDGALVKLRVAAEHLRLMGDIGEGGDPYFQLVYQAWEGLETEPIDFERIMREAPS